MDRAPVCVAVNPRHRLALRDELPRLADLEGERVVVIGEGGLPNSYHTMRARVLELGFCAPSIVQVNKLEEILGGSLDEIIDSLVAADRAAQLEEAQQA